MWSPILSMWRVLFNLAPLPSFLSFSPLVCVPVISCPTIWTPATGYLWFRYTEETWNEKQNVASYSCGVFNHRETKTSNKNDKSLTFDTTLTVADRVRRGRWGKVNKGVGWGRTRARALDSPLLNQWIRLWKILTVQLCFIFDRIFLVGVYATCHVVPHHCQLKWLHLSDVSWDVMWVTRDVVWTSVLSPGSSLSPKLRGKKTLVNRRWRDLIIVHCKPTKILN